MEEEQAPYWRPLLLGTRMVTLERTKLFSFNAINHSHHWGYERKRRKGLMKITGSAPPNFLPNIPKVCRKTSRGSPFLFSVFPHPSLGQNKQKYREFRFPCWAWGRWLPVLLGNPNLQHFWPVHSEVEEFSCSSLNRRLYPGRKKKQITIRWVGNK